jgi:hypothetical protein
MPASRELRKAGLIDAGIVGVLQVGPGIGRRETVRPVMARGVAMIGDAPRVVRGEHAVAGRSGNRDQPHRHCRTLGCR